MFRQLSVFTICLILAGCDLDNLLHEPFSWAVVDERVVTHKLTTIAKRQNPYPEALRDLDDLNAQRRRLNQQVSDLKRQETDRCVKNKEKQWAESLQSRHPAIVGPLIEHKSLPFRRECLTSASNDPLVKDLSEKMLEVNQLLQDRRKHDQKVRTAVKVRLNQVVNERFNSEFDLVLTKRDDIILYNKTNRVVDVTAQLLEYIDTVNLVISIDDRT